MREEQYEFWWGFESWSLLMFGRVRVCPYGQWIYHRFLARIHGGCGNVSLGMRSLFATTL